MNHFEGTVIDVRSRDEFARGNVLGSINFPLHEIQDREAEVMALPTPIVFCCAAGIRSGQAYHYFKQKGLDCSNGGSWNEVEDALKRN